ncbi:hypothetical protein [Devriesea agamarum]|uniref:hypothetical protein n=1 Tax=Devriesea agamarum TaxID=472569 RepID=UPI00071E5B28|nr:hypothetical protein [Devriesea agamarum]
MTSYIRIAANVATFAALTGAFLGGGMLSASAAGLPVSHDSTYRIQVTPGKYSNEIKMDATVSNDGQLKVEANGDLDLLGGNGKRNQIPSSIKTNSGTLNGRWTLKNSHEAEYVGTAKESTLLSANDSFSWVDCNLDRIRSGTVTGAIGGCVADIETGCLPGASAGAAVGMISGAIDGILNCHH